MPMEHVPPVVQTWMEPGPTPARKWMRCSDVPVLSLHRTGTSTAPWPPPQRALGASCKVPGLKPTRC